MKLDYDKVMETAKECGIELNRRQKAFLSCICYSGIVHVSRGFSHHGASTVMDMVTKTYPAEVFRAIPKRTLKGQPIQYTHENEINTAFGMFLCSNCGAAICSGDHVFEYEKDGYTHLVCENCAATYPRSRCVMKPPYIL